MTTIIIGGRTYIHERFYTIDLGADHYSPIPIGQDRPPCHILDKLNRNVSVFRDTNVQLAKRIARHMNNEEHAYLQLVQEYADPTAYYKSIADYIQTYCLAYAAETFEQTLRRGIKPPSR
jgi:hypothetical protein